MRAIILLAIALTSFSLFGCSSAKAPRPTEAAIHGFNFDKDLARFYEIQGSLMRFHPHHLDSYEVKQAKEKNRAAIFAHYGITNEAQWDEISSVGNSYALSDRANEIYGSDDAIRKLQRRYQQSGSVRVEGREVVTCQTCSGETPNEAFVKIVSTFRDEVVSMETALSTKQDELGFTTMISQQNLADASKIKAAIGRLDKLQTILVGHFSKITQLQTKMFSDLQSLAKRDPSQKAFYEEFTRKRDLPEVGYNALYKKRKAAHLDQIKSYKRALSALQKAGDKFQVLENGAGMAFHPDIVNIAKEYESAILEFNQSSQALRAIFAQFDQLNTKRSY